MRKHLIRLIIAYACFELFRKLGGELPELFSGKETFTWVSNKKIVLISISDFFIFLLYPLISFIIFQKYFITHKKKAIALFIVSGISIISLRYLIEEIIFLKLFGFHNYYDGVPLLFYFVDNTYYAIVYSAFGILYFFLQNEQQRKLEHKQLQLENKQSQLSFLISQINPHFLFNNLNNIYSLVYQKSPHSLEAISKLSEILRYMLYENNDKVALSKELDYIQKYIDLQKIRFDKPLHIQQEIEVDNRSFFIPPLILISFVENAFKHGDFSHDLIHMDIRIKTTGNKLDFSISNSKAKDRKGMSGGLGLQNIQKRLELLYLNKHSLKLNEDDNNFTVNLQLLN